MNIEKIDYLLQPHQVHLFDRLKRKIQDDVLMYDILAISKETVLLYFAEPDQVSGGCNVYTDENLPDGLFSSGGILANVKCVHKNTTAIFSRIYVTMPFAEAERAVNFEHTPSFNRFEFLNKYKGLKKIVSKLPKKYRVVELKDNPRLVDEYKQKKVTNLIEQRVSNHQHSALHYNNAQLSLSSATLNKNKIAVFALHWLDFGGAERFAVDSIKFAAAKGWESYVVVDKRGNKPYETVLRKHTKAIFYIADGLPQHYWSRFYVNLFLRINPRIFHIHHAISAYQMLPKIRSLTNNPRIIDTTHIVEHADGGFPRISGVYGPYIDLHHVISHDLEGYLKHYLSVPDSKIGLGYLVPRGKQLPNLSESVKKFDNIEKECRVLFVGRFALQKRPYLFVEFAKHLLEIKAKKKLQTKFVFQMVGEGQFYDICVNLIKRNKMEADIKLLPAQSDVNKLMQESHYLVISSENEGLTLVAYEAIEHDCIVVSTNVGAQRELISGAALTPRNPKRFIERGSELVLNGIKNPEILSKLLKEQREKYQDVSQHTWEDLYDGIY